MGLAVAARVRAHAQAMSPLRRCVCPRQAVSIKAKLTFVDSLATSRLCRSVGAWDRLAKGQRPACARAGCTGWWVQMRDVHAAW